MTRSFGDNADGGSIPISQDSVKAFFNERARRLDDLGPTRAVIYQDKHPDLAERRDAAERAQLLPLLNLNPGTRVLDVGCGTGRWVPTLYPLVSHYHGIDITTGLIEYARTQFNGLTTAQFSVAAADDFSLDSIGELSGFDRVLSAGVLIYLDDARLSAALVNIRGSLRGCRPLLLFREPVAQGERLTLRDHYSEEMGQTYTAIYRTESELGRTLESHFSQAGLSLLARGDVFLDADLNNRAETKQRWFIVGRAE